MADGPRQKFFKMPTPNIVSRRNSLKTEKQRCVTSSDPRPSNRVMLKTGVIKLNINLF